MSYTMNGSIGESVCRGMRICPNIQGTAGCNRDSFYCQISGVNASVFHDARGKIPGCDGTSRRAKKLIDDLDFYIDLCDIQFDLPRILVDVCSDEIYLEWIFSHFRIGMLVNRDPDHDAWFIIGDDVMNDVDENHRLDVRGLTRIASIVSIYGNES